MVIVEHITQLLSEHLFSAAGSSVVNLGLMSAGVPSMAYGLCVA